MSAAMRGDAHKRTVSPAPVKLRLDELSALADASWRGGRGGWLSRAEIAEIERILTARLGGAS